MFQTFSTERLTLTPLQVTDSEFMLALLNSPEFITFIGDRRVRSLEDASWYINRIIEDPAFDYWVVRLKEGNTAIGAVTFIKRDYLDHHDIGFAFLSDFTKMGYAFEAANVVLQHFITKIDHEFIMGTTAVHNVNSIQLLEKLGLKRQNKMKIAGREAWLFSTVLAEI